MRHGKSGRLIGKKLNYNNVRVFQVSVHACMFSFGGNCFNDTRNSIMNVFKVQVREHDSFAPGPGLNAEDKRDKWPMFFYMSKVYKLILDEKHVTIISRKS